MIGPATSGLQMNITLHSLGIADNKITYNWISFIIKHEFVNKYITFNIGLYLHFNLFSGVLFKLMHMCYFSVVISIA